MSAALLVAAGVALTLAAFPPLSLALLAAVMLAPLVAALEGRSPRAGFTLAYLYQFGVSVGIARWLVHPLVEEYAVGAAPAWTFALCVAAAYAIPLAAAAALYCALRPRLSSGSAALVFAALFALAEWLRSEPGGLPWALAAHALTGHPLAIQTADLGGPYALAFVVAALNAGLGVAARTRRAAPLLAPLALTLAVGGYGALRLAQFAGEGDAIRVGVVQASVPQSQRFRPGSAERNVARHMALSRELAGREALDLLVWSETAVDVDLDTRPDLGAALARLVDEIDVPLLTGAPRSVDGRPTNAAVLFLPGAGLVEWYDKQRLVPFAEYDPPFASLLAPLLAPVTSGRPYAPGRQSSVLQRAPARLAAPICFEITYPDLIRRFRAAGAEILVNLTNDAWFGPSGYAEMHFAHAVLRAVETRLPVVRGANTGVSGAIDPAGRVVARLPIRVEGSFVVDLQPPGDAPPYARFGDAPVLAALGLTATAPVLASRRRRARG